MKMQDSTQKFDFIIIGSGFGGSVSAMRLSQKGYKVLLLEKGRKYTNLDFPKTNWNLRKFLWAPLFRLFGIQEITLLNKIMILHGVGVGGGSLVYANTLMKPQDSVFNNLSWPKNFLINKDSCYKTASKMLGVTENKIIAAADEKFKLLADKMKTSDTYHLTQVGVCFSMEKALGGDPYFSGDGPTRQACTGCGACMIGCPVGAKNTLDKNYLYFAEKWGCQIESETLVKKIIPLEKGYKITTHNSMYPWKKRSFFAERVILSAGVLGTLKILFENKFKYKTLPDISDQLGKGVRTNGESLCGVTSLNQDTDYSKGIAIGSAIHPDTMTKIEPVRYPAGSDLMRFLAVPLTGNGNKFFRPLKLMLNMLKNFFPFSKIYFSTNWAKHSIILLVMQTIEEKIDIKYTRSIFNLFKKNLTCDDRNHSIKSYLPIAQSASIALANVINGIPQNAASEVLLGIPATAHILGGCNFGLTIKNGVIDENQQIFGYKNLFIADGSVIPANLGVNPSLTITAMSENFCIQFPNILDHEKKEIIYG